MVSPITLQHLLVAQGLPTFKAFLASKDRLMLTPRELRQVMQAVAAANARLLVHAEDGDLNAATEERLVTTGRTRWGTPSKGVSSTIFGSIIRKRSSVGRNL